MNVRHSITPIGEKRTDRDLTRQWESIDWKKVRSYVNRLQTRIAKATREGKWNLVKRLQYLLTHSYYGKLLAVRIVTQNQGARTLGLGNGILQDILFNAKMHPKKKAGSLSDGDKEALFDSLKTTISAMASNGGRDTERDLFGNPGGYKTILCKNTANKPCATCGTMIKKESYMGGSVYYCDKCQEL